MVAHRRWGKDDVALHRTCVAAFERVANYWHMLPKSNQVRKAIWEAVNPRTGKRRIDEAFPHELRASTREADMMIKFKNGSTWQALGSDNFEGAIGSTPAGIVFSEWAQAHPSARGYLRPILAENNGWQIFITTPRGKNHAHRTFKAAKKNNGAFAQILTAADTPVFTPEQLEIERQEMIGTYGADMGEALFRQEYFCSFEAAVLGALWGGEFAKLEREGRFIPFDHNPDYPVYVAMDIGKKDATSIWWWQVIANEIRYIDFLTDSFRDVDYYCGQMIGREVKIDIVGDDLRVEYGDPLPEAEHRSKYEYETIALPHDAKAQRLGSKKTVEEQFRKVFGWGKLKILPPCSKNKTDEVRYIRQMLRKAWFNETLTESGVEACKAYQYEWDEGKQRFKDNPLHNWASDPGDALIYSGMAWRDMEPPRAEEPKPKPDPYGFDEDDTDSWKTA